MSPPSRHGRSTFSVRARLDGMEGFWPIFFLLVVLKVPVLGMIWLLWWATIGRQQPETSEDDGGAERLRPRQPWRPSGPRRDPHGGGIVLRPAPSHGSRVRQADAVRDRARSRERARSFESARK